IESKKLFPTESGTPQGGIISPILSNMTLDGLARRLKEKFGNRPIGINLVRYADDFIVSSTTKECLEEAIKPLIIDFLAERGL
ncbi:reverse transcriptase domain-containing protein, partial [Vibrio parahaemolyticus]